MIENQEYCIAGIFRNIARQYPRFPAIINDEGIITYAQLMANVISFAKKMKSLDVSNNSVVALNSGDTPITLSVMLATSLLGCQFVTAGKVLSRQEAIVPTHFFKTADAKGKGLVNFIEIDKTWIADITFDPFTAVDNFTGYTNENDPWIALHTSGTTGKPKFFTLSQRVVADRTAAISEDFPLARTTCAMLFKSNSRPFYARAIGILLNACTIVDGYDTLLWKKSGVKTVFGSPGQFAEFMEDRGIGAHFQNVEISGAKLTNDLARKLSEYFDNIIDVYGASETNKSFANIVRVTDDGVVNRTGVKLDSEIQILDRNGEFCKPGQVGTVRVRNGYLTGGYLNADAANEKAFRQGWFYPGDIGTWGPNGELDIIGRNDEIISFGGVKINAQLIDLIIKSTNGVKDAVCFKNPKPNAKNEVIAFVVFEEDINRAGCVVDIRENYQMRTGLPCFLGRLHEVDEVPYNENGRPLRDLCAQMALSRSGNIVDIAG